MPFTCVLYLGAPFTHKLFKDKLGTVSQVCDTRRGKSHPSHGVGFSCPFPVPSISFPAQSGAVGKREKYLGQDYQPQCPCPQAQLTQARPWTCWEAALLHFTELSYLSIFCPKHTTGHLMLLKVPTPPSPP